MSVYDTIGAWDYEREEYITSRKVGKPMGRDAPHYPNKAERVLLTQMMQKSGQTEEQVRSNIDNRRKLAEAAKSMSVSQAPRRPPGFRARLHEKRAKRAEMQYLSSPQYFWNMLSK